MLSDVDLSTIGVTEADGSGSMVYEMSRITGQRRFKAPWGSRHAIARALVGSVGGSTAAPLLINPDQWPDVPGLLCRRVTVEKWPGCAVEGAVSGSGLIVDTISHVLAMITAEYDTSGPSPTSSDQDAAAEEEYETNAEFLNTGATGWTWEATGAQVKPDLSPGILIPQTAMSIPRAGRRTTPGVGILPYLGKINSTSFRGAGVGKVLYVGASIKQRFIHSGASVEPTYDYVHKFLLKDRDWREIYDPERGVWDKLKQGSAFLYETANLNNVLSFT